MLLRIGVTVLRILLVLTFIINTSTAQNSGGQAAIPNTAPGRLLKQWLDVFNSGDVARYTTFEGEHVSEASRKMPPADAAKREMQFRDMIGGGFDLYKVEASSDTEIKALLREKGGAGWGEIVLRVDAAKPDVIAAMDSKRVPAPAEMRPAREDQAALVKDLEHFLQNLVAQDRFSGVVLMAKEGKPFFEKAYGYADRDKKIPNDMDTKFRIGSMNKMFTSVAIAQLVQQGKLQYMDTVAKLLPDYPDKDAAAKITVHELLTHTSGLGDFFGPEFDQKKDNLRELKDYLQFFAGKPLRFEPGKGWAYSNAGMIVAGLIVERVSGQNYFDYVREHVYKPAGMKDSDSYEKTKPQPDQSVGYTKKDGKWISNYDTLPLMGSSAGGGDSTAPDLLRFDQSLRGHKLLNAELTSTITTGKVNASSESRYGYGFGETLVDGKRVVGHSGGAPGMNSTLDMYWDSGYTVIVLANLDPPVAQQVTEYIRDRIEP